VDEMLRSHAIDPTTLRRDDFEGFFAARTRALMKLIEEAMGKCLTVEPFQESVAGYKNGNGNGLGRSILVNN
jgi:hypothetical protein